MKLSKFDKHNSSSTLIVKGEYDMKDILRKFIKDWICLIAIAILVSYGWRGLRILMIKGMIPDDIDTVVEFILTLSLYGNFKAVINKVRS